MYNMLNREFWFCIGEDESVNDFSCSGCVLLRLEGEYAWDPQTSYVCVWVQD